MRSWCTYCGIACAIVIVAVICAACENPFATRDPEPPATGGAAIRPATTPENVLANLEVSFESLSIQDYLDVFSDDFSFHPDPEDSLAYEQEFTSGWDLDRERIFANNLLIGQNFIPVDGNPIEVTASYEYKPGPDMYEYHYQMFLPLVDQSEDGFRTIEIEGYAFLYFSEDTEGNWTILAWEDHRLTARSQTWGVLRAQHS